MLIISNKGASLYVFTFARQHRGQHRNICSTMAPDPEDNVRVMVCKGDSCDYEEEKEVVNGPECTSFCVVYQDKAESGNFILVGRVPVVVKVLERRILGVECSSSTPKGIALLKEYATNVNNSLTTPSNSFAYHTDDQHKIRCILDVICDAFTVGHGGEFDVDSGHPSTVLDKECRRITQFSLNAMAAAQAFELSDFCDWVAVEAVRIFNCRTDIEFYLFKETLFTNLCNRYGDHKMEEVMDVYCDYDKLLTEYDKSICGLTLGKERRDIFKYDLYQKHNALVSDNQIWVGYKDKLCDVTRQQYLAAKSQVAQEDRCAAEQASSQEGSKPSAKKSKSS